MLVLSFGLNDSVEIEHNGEKMIVTVLENKHHKKTIRLAFDAKRSFNITRTDAKVKGPKNA